MCDDKHLHTLLNFVIPQLQKFFESFFKVTMAFLKIDKALGEYYASLGINDYYDADKKGKFFQCMSRK